MKIQLLLAFLALCSCQSLWPYPSSVSFGSTTLTVQSKFQFEVVGASSTVLTDAITRYQTLIFWAGQGDWPATTSVPLSTISINVLSSNLNLQAGINESYSLSITASEATLTAETVFGALHGLETFSQLVAYTGSVYEIADAPIFIEDTPRFPHRGLLIDTARHFLPIATIERTVDALAYNKFNVLHWHIVDAESFPAQSQSYPGLTAGAWNPKATYSTAEITGVIQYAYARGVRVVPEFDTPGHTGSWGATYPIISKCPQWSGNVDNIALDLSNPQTLPLVTGLFTEMSSLFPDHMFHIGGDEVVYQCWLEDSGMTSWMQQQGYGSNCNLVMQYYEDAIWAHMTSLNKTMIAWEEVFNEYNLNHFPGNLIIEVWKDEPTLLSVAQADMRGLLAYGWYLDQLTETWEDFYANEPFQSSQWTPTLENYILGGDVCAWGELLDQASYDGTIWPRTSAAGERLWSPRSVDNASTAEPRIIDMICRMNRRGIMATPLVPSFCLGFSTETATVN